MSQPNEVVVVDYGLGNLFSLKRSIERVCVDTDLTPVISSIPEIILNASKLILPGVGAFGDGMKNLYEKKLVDPICDFAKSGKPLLGICLGMQLFMTESEEFGHHKGLDLIPGRVIRFAESKTNYYKIPNIGWRNLQTPKHCTDWKNTILEDIRTGAFMYFVHSYYVIPKDFRHMLAETTYGETVFCSVVQYKNVSGCQFHPEKSGEEGLAILKSFLSTNLISKTV